MCDTTIQLLTEGFSVVAGYFEPAGALERRGAVVAAWCDFEARVRRAPDAIPLARLVRRLDLDTFEVQSLLVALSAHARIELETAQAQALVGATIDAAVEHLCTTEDQRGAARAALQPNARLLRHNIVTFTAADESAPYGFLSQRLRLTTPALRFLLDEPALTPTIATVARLVLPPAPDRARPRLPLTNVILPPEQIAALRQLVAHHGPYRALLAKWGLAETCPSGGGLTLLLAGSSGTGKTLLAHALAGSISRPLIALSAAALPREEALAPLLRDLFAEADLREAVVLVEDVDAVLDKSDPRRSTFFEALERFAGIAVLTTRKPKDLDPAIEQRVVYQLTFELPSPDLRFQLWETHLPPEIPLAGDIDLRILADRYDFTGGTIRNAILFAAKAALEERPDEPVLTMELLDRGCRSQLHYALDDLTVRTTTHLRLPDLVLPDEQMRRIEDMLAACRNQTTVLNHWGFGERLVTGKGITALFDGPPGTGKTYAAEIVAGELGRPLYRVNIPDVVSKWVGETEKHISAIFQHARVGHAMLLFDEADSLFASRVAEARTAMDRSANMEVNLLLQEIERFPGICILTTNFYSLLDRALIRRIQFRVRFEEPDIEQRARIWQVLCPSRAPLAEDVDFHALAETYELTGGLIKNALLRAAYWSADQDDVIRQETLQRSCREECIAAGKLTRDAAAGTEGARPRTARAASYESHSGRA